MHSLISWLFTCLLWCYPLDKYDIYQDHQTMCNSSRKQARSRTLGRFTARCEIILILTAPPLFWTLGLANGPESCSWMVLCTRVCSSFSHTLSLNMTRWASGWVGACERLVLWPRCCVEDVGIVSMGTVAVADGVMPNLEEWQGSEKAGWCCIACWEGALWESLFESSGSRPMTVFGRSLWPGSACTRSSLPALCHTMHSATLDRKRGADDILDLRSLVMDGTCLS